MKLALQVSLLLLVVIASCQQFKHDNVYDPASDRYLPSQLEVRGVLVNDFDDNSTGLWGHTYKVFVVTGRVANIFKKLVTEVTPDGRTGLVMQLDYDVSANDSSLVIWSQVLGDTDPCCGPFNARTMSLKSLSFFLRGGAGGEKFDVKLRDVDGIETSTTATVTAGSSWEKKQISLDALAAGGAKSPVDLRKLEAVNFSFYHGLVGPSDKGTVFIDKVMFEWE